MRSDIPLFQLKKQMCEVGKRIWIKGFCGGNEGNHSVRVSDDRVLCTPTGISKGFLTPDELCLVDMDGNQVEKNSKGTNRTSEVLIHLAIYKERDDIGAVVHSHPPHATAFAIAGIPLPEGLHPEAEVFLGHVPMAKYATPSKPELAESLLPLIGSDTNTILMGNHGTVTFDKTLISTYYKLEILDAYCRILLLCHSLGNANVLPQDKMTELLQVKESFGFPDARLACAPDGCVGQNNEAYFSMFDVRPASAQCSSGSCEVVSSGNVNSSQGKAMGTDRQEFENMVQAITDQIMTAAG